jgi:hypothetical protein
MQVVGWVYGGIFGVHGFGHCRSWMVMMILVVMAGAGT